MLWTASSVKDELQGRRQTLEKGRRARGLSLRYKDYIMAGAPSHRVSSGERLNTAETTGPLQQSLRTKRIRLTRQRRVILQVMDAAEQHLDVDQILERAQKINAGVHLVTVYRTIDLLKKHGLIDELDLLHLRGDRHYYETHGPRDHIHVACLRCGKVREFESRLYEQLKQQIARDFQMQVTVSRTEVGGICNECLAGDGGKSKAKA